MPNENVHSGCMEKSLPPSIQSQWTFDHMNLRCRRKAETWGLDTSPETGLLKLCQDFKVDLDRIQQRWQSHIQNSSVELVKFQMDRSGGLYCSSSKLFPVHRQREQHMSWGLGETLHLCRTEKPLWEHPLPKGHGQGGRGTQLLLQHSMFQTSHVRGEGSSCVCLSVSQ